MRFLFVLLIAVAAALGAGYYWYDLVVRPVRIVEVKRGTAAEIVYATGVVEPVNWAKIVSLQRKRIEWTCDCEGQQVKKGDVLVRLDDAEERAVLAELEARRTRLQQDVERLRGLVARNVTPRTTLEQTLTQLQEFEARIIAQAERIGDLQLRSPMDGVVLRLDGEIGEVAGTGAGDTLVWVGKPKPLQIVADVSEDDIVRVKPGQNVLLRSEGFSQTNLTAAVREITPKGDPATKTFRVYLDLPEDTPLRIGMSVEANVVTRQKSDVLLAPSEAILSGAAFVVKDGRLERRKIETGIRGARMVEVVKGLSPGESVVVPATAALSSGMRVREAGNEGASP